MEMLELNFSGQTESFSSQVIQGVLETVFNDRSRFLKVLKCYRSILATK